MLWWLAVGSMLYPLRLGAGLRQRLSLPALCGCGSMLLCMSLRPTTAFSGFAFLVDLLRPNCLMRSSRGLAPNVVRVFHIPAPGLGIDVYCLPLRGHSMLTVLLTDVSECDARPMLYSAAVPGPAVPTLSALRRDNTVLGAFWSAVLARQPSIMSHVILPASQVRTGMSLAFLHLGLDFCRAYDHGLRVDRHDVLHNLDLAELRPEAFRAAPPPGHLMLGLSEDTVC